MLEVAYREEDPDSVILGVCSGLFRGLLAKVKATAKQENEGKDAKIVRLTGELNNLDENLRAKGVENEQLKEQRDTLVTDLGVANENLRVRNGEVANLQENVRVKDAELAGLQETIRVKDAGLDKLQADLRTVTEEREDFRKGRNQNSKNLRKANEKLKRTEEVS